MTCHFDVNMAWLAAPVAAAATPVPTHQSIWFWVTIAVLILIILGLVAYLIWRHRHPKAAAGDKDEEKAAKPENQEAAAELPQGFQAALAMQQSLVEGRDFRYRMPWFLLLGAPGSGKSSLLSDSSLAGSVEERAGVEPASGLAWNFLNDAVVVDTGGWVLTPGEANAALWVRLLKLFRDTRPERPLDGLVLTVAAEDLVGDKALLPAHMIERGALIQQRLRHLTRTLGFQLPLYLLITKCDALEGFRPFAQELEPDELNQIFGWSNPYSDRLQFQPEWVDEAVNAMRVTTERVQGRLFATHEGGPGREAMFLFPGSLYATMAPLRLLLSRALRGGGDSPAPILRGIYCAGATEGQVHVPARQPELIPVSRPTDGFGGGTAVSYEEDHPATTLSLSATIAALQSKLRIGFVHDVFVDKIFPERNLGRPLEQFFAARDKVRTSLQIASASVALLLTAGTAISYHRLTRDAERLQDLLGSIYSDLSAPAVYTLDPNQLDTRAGASDLLDTLANFESGGFRSVFLPASWVSSLPGQIRETMVQAFRQLVLARFYGGLSARAAWLADPSQLPLKAADLPSAAPGGMPVTELERTPDYLEMQAFLREMHALDQHIALYNRICRPNSSEPLQSIIELDGYLHNRTESTPVTTGSNPYFQQAMDEATYQCYTYTPIARHAVTTKAEVLITNLDGAWIAHNPVRGMTEVLVSDFNRMNTPGAVDASDATKVSDHLRQAQAIYTAPELRWAGASPITVPSNLAAVTTGVTDMSPFFEPGMETTVATITDGDLSQLLSALSGAETALTGPVLDTATGQIALSAGAQEVQTSLDALEKASFVTGAGQEAVSLEVARPAGIVWDKSGLESASTLPAAYGKFMADALGKGRAPVRVAVGRIAAAAASASVQSALLQAEHPSANNDALAEAQSFNDAAPAITGLLGTLGQYGLTAPMIQLRSVAVHQAAGVLNDLNANLLKTQPYQVEPAFFTHWTAGAPTSALFGAATSDALTGYLTAQHDQVATLNTAAVPAVRFLEGNRAYLPAGSARVLTEWEGIGAALEGFAAKKPGNSVATLETLISTEVDKITPENGCVLPKSNTAGRLDYFALAASDLERSLQVRCQYLLNQGFENAYARLANAFNHDLAERFPFAPLTSLPLAEADPAAITSTYRLFDTAADLLRSSRARTAAPVAQIFLSRFDDARPWFAPLLSTANNGTLTLDLVPAFRVERAREIGGDQIIDWTLQVGAATVHAGDAPAKLHWNLGDPVILSLRWARNSPFLPAPKYPPDDSAGALKSNGDTVTWKFTDTWSLLRFLRSFERDDPGGNAVAKTPGEEPFLLEFDIPVLPANATTAGPQPAALTTVRVYLRALVSAPGQKDSLPRDQFPQVAPPLMAHPIHAATQSPLQSQEADAQ